MTIQDRLDTLPLSRFHYRLMILCGLGWLFDAMDTLLMGVVMPKLAEEWAIGNIARGVLLTSSTVGMGIGAAVAGTLADRVGRQRLFQWTLLLFSIATALCAFAQGYYSLLILQFFVGIGLGGELPVASSLVAEFAPAAYRGRLVVLMESFWAAGALVMALVGRLIPLQGWRFVFLVGALPALYVLVLRRAMPESPRFLIARGREHEALSVLRRVEAAIGEAPAEVELEATPSPKIRVTELLGRNLRRRTLILWGIWFGMLFSYYGLFKWLPSLLKEAGFSLESTYNYTILITLFQLPGYLIAALLVDRLGRRRSLVLFLVPSSVASLAWALFSAPALMAIFGSLLSFFFLGAFGVLYTYTPELFPTRLRASGAGWASAVGRSGAILGPFAVGWLLDVFGKQGFVFAMFAGVLLASAAVASTGEETGGQSLEAISE